MTNGEKILNAFPNTTTRACKNIGFTYIEVEQNDKWIADFDMEWWNAEYKEPTIKNVKFTNSEWIDFLCERFEISRTSAKEMLHAMMSVKKEDNFKKQFNQVKAESEVKDGNVD